jgi:hypothetical protein
MHYAIGPVLLGIYAGHMFSQGSTQSKTTYKVALNYRNDIEMLFLKHKLLPLATAVPSFPCSATFQPHYSRIFRLQNRLFLKRHFTTSDTVQPMFLFR